jgi:hypothetical protein
MGVGNLAALADAAHVRAAGLEVGSTIRVFTTQDARTCTRGHPRRCSDEADHVRMVSDRYDHSGVPRAGLVHRKEMIATTNPCGR